jgi:hypothetical protein
MRLEEHASCMRDMRNAYILVGKPKGKRLLRRPSRRWEDSVKMYFREIGLDGVYWINLAQDRD